MPRGGRASTATTVHPGAGPVITHWSGPPQHAGYRSGQTGHGDGWPERGGRGPQPGPHIPNLYPREEHRPQPPHMHSGFWWRPVPRRPFQGEERHTGRRYR